MRSLYFNGTRAAICDRPEPSPSPGEAIVRVHWAGVCNTDLELARGYMGFRGILGHEFVGVVESGPDELFGRRVVGEINFGCGHCDRCRAGLRRHCDERRVMGILNADGAFATHLSVPAENLHPVPDGIADEAAVFTEPLAAAFEILEQLPEIRGQHGVVLGDGKLGLLTAQVLASEGARIVSVGKHSDKLALLADRGIETALASDWQPERQAVDFVVEATGAAASLERALAAVRPRGTVVLKSTVAEAHAIDLAPVVINEIQLLGSRCGPFEPALEALASGAVDVAPMVSERIPLAQANGALERAAASGVLKVLIDCT